MKNIIIHLACAVLFFTNANVSAQQEEPDQEALKEMQAFENAFAGAFSAAPEEQAILDSFFKAYNNGEFQTLYAQQFSAKMQTVKSYEKFQENINSAKNKTGIFLSARVTGAATGQQLIMSTDTGQPLEEEISISTQTRKWKADFETGTYYLSFDFYKEDEELKLYRVKLSDSNFSPTFDLTL